MGKTTQAQVANHLEENKNGTSSDTIFQKDQSIKWKTNKNHKVSIRKLGDSMYLEISGWVAIIISFGQLKGLQIYI